MSIRSRALNRCFDLLYGPLVFLHEPAGKCLFGRAWDGRRRMLLQHVDAGGWLLDVGCGRGHLLERAVRQGRPALGIDPSTSMLKMARRWHLPVVQSRAEALPLASESISSIVATYPGPWIRDAEVWTELFRVLKPGGSVAILLGGTVERGRGAAVRSGLSMILYGPALPERIAFDPPLPDSFELSGSLCKEVDSWGTAFYWRGAKRGN